MSFKVTCDKFMLIFSVWRRNPIHACLSIPNYHHSNYLVCDLPSYLVLKIWVQVGQICAHQCQHRCYVEELKHFNNQLLPRWVGEVRVWEIRSHIGNSHLLPPLEGWLSWFMMWYIYIYAWNYCIQYCIQQIKHEINAYNTIYKPI